MTKRRSHRTYHSRHAWSFAGYLAPRAATGESRLAALVCDLFRWYADEGRSFMAVVQRLRDLGAPSPSGREYWGMATVRSIFSAHAWNGPFCSMASVSR